MTTHKPNVLLTVYQATTKRYAQETIVISGTAYDDGRILNEPKLKVEMPEEFYGVADPYDIEIEIDDLTILNNEVRDIFAKVEVYDETDGLSFIGYGSIRGYNKNFNESVKLIITLNEYPKLNRLMPYGLVTTDLFHETARDVGAPINIPFGYCKDVWCPNIKWDTIENHYDYLVGYADVWGGGISYTIGASNIDVKRGWKIANTDDWELIEDEAPYPGYVVIRFRVPQIGFSGEYYDIHVDINGYSSGSGTVARNRATAIRSVLNNSVYGLDEDVDVTSFYNASMGSPKLNDEESYFHYCIGNGNQRPARDILEDMLFPHAYLYRASDNEIEIKVVNGSTDGFGSSVATIGHNDGLYNNCEIIDGPNQIEVEDYPKTLKVNYNFRRNEKGEEIYDTLECTTSRSYGTDMVIDLPTVQDEAVADRCASIFWGRSVYSDHKMSILMDNEGKSFEIADKLTVANTEKPFDTYDEWFIVGFEKTYDGRWIYHLRSTHDDFYDYDYTTTSITAQAPIADYTGVRHKSIDFTAVDGATYAIDTRGYARAYNRWRFESGARTTDSQGNDNLSEGGSPTTDTGDYCEGSASALLGSSDYFIIADASLSANHPLKSSVDSDESFAVLTRKKFDSSVIGASTATNLIVKHSTSPELGAYLRKHTDDKIRAVTSPDGTTSNDTMENDTACIAGNWYGILYCYNAELGKEILHVFDITGDETHGTDIVQACEGVHRSTAALYVGSSPFVGNVDDTLIFDHPVSIEEADEMFSDPSNWGPVTMTLPTSPNACHVVAFDAYSNFNTQNFTAASSALFHGGAWGTHTYSTDKEWCEYKYVDPLIGYIKMN